MFSLLLHFLLIFDNSLANKHFILKEGREIGFGNGILIYATG